MKATLRLDFLCIFRRRIKSPTDVKGRETKMSLEVKELALEDIFCFCKCFVCR